MVELTVRGNVVKVVGVVAVGMVVVGCGDTGSGATSPPTSSVSVAASPTSVDAEATVWDPCSLPDSAVSGVGLNAGSKKKDVAGVDFTGWKVCSWMDSEKKYTFAVMASEHTLAESRQRTSEYTGWSDLTVGSHNALEFRPIGSANDVACYVSVEVPTGSVDFKVQNRVSAVGAAEPCGEARRLSTALVQYLPAS
ncbi:DUF3558 domain-containing protein [Nocardia sp. NPDC057663]|uniref:DUF3558 domain-containing protein n=1 Tax=Nocardia sp. NPDC057663 TaxID=3346201 RepID=UPI00366EC5FE